MNYAGFDVDAWNNFRDNLGSRSSIKLFNMFLPEEDAKKLAVTYTTLRLVDDGVDQKWDGEGEDPRRHFLDTMERMWLEANPDDYRNDLEAKEIMAANDPLELLIPKPGEEITAKRTERLLKCFYHNYRHLDSDGMGFLQEKLRNFFGGMRADLDKEGKLFSQEELDEYFHAIQAEPVIMGFLTVLDLKNDLPDDVSYDEFYDAVKSLSKQIVNLKDCRGKELLEDAEMNRVYFSVEELYDAGFGRDGFLGVLDLRKDDPRMKELIKKRVHKANAYMKESEEVMSKLPNEGAYVGIHKYFVAFGLLSKTWAQKLAKNDYNPFRNGKCANLEPGKFGKLKTFLNAKSYGKKEGRNERIRGRVTDWGFLDGNYLREALQLVDYWVPTGE
ncbi:hypothetical protein E2P64_00155 [Candidatus Bathyarchaeota archaeon]|nr:hypothetical protein E2P64_00155 [Candidatus Bathyarchaeota archaeon]